MLRDRALPLLPEMLGAGAVDMLAAAAGARDQRVVAAKPVQVSWRPGRSLHVQYDAQIEIHGASPQTATFVAATGGEPPAGATALTRDGAQVAVWPMREDPYLPGIAVALDPEASGRLLDSLGAPGGPVTARVRAYRPGRRAVVELVRPGFRAFVKVVQPHRIAALQARHALLANHLRVPASHGWSDEHGLVVLEALPGLTLREALTVPNERVPSATDLFALLDQIPDPGDGVMHASPARTVAGHAALIQRLLPDESETIAAIVGGCEQATTSGEAVPVHGDYYEAQVLTQDGSLTGLLDIDSVAMGERVSDFANFIGHLAVWGPLSPDAERVAGYTRAMTATALERADKDTLGRQVAAVIVGLATGPFRTLTRNWPQDTRDRLAFAAAWLEWARSTDEKALTPVSEASHAGGRR